MYLSFRRSDGIRLLFAVAILTLALTHVSSAQLRISGEPAPLTGGDRVSMNPSWSPDGSRIAFTESGYIGINILDLRTGAINAITDEAAAGFGFEWAPDGGSILARVARFDGPRRYNAVKVFDVSSGESRELTEYRSMMSSLPHWDAAGERVFLYAEEGLEVFEDPSALKQGREYTALVAADNRILKAELVSREVEPVAAPDEEVAAPDEGVVLNLTRSPGGSYVAFERMGGNMYAMRADGSGVVDLGPGSRPAWSPDGEWIVFMRTEDDGHSITASDLFAVRPDGSDRTQLTSTPDHLEMNPSWSPDGTRIAYDNLTDGIIYAVSVAP